MSIKVTATTMGVSTPASVAEGTRWYRYRGGQPGNEPSPAEPQPQNAKATAERAARLAEFAGYLAQGLTAKQAGKLIGVKPTTVRAYERELREQQRREAPS